MKIYILGNIFVIIASLGVNRITPEYGGFTFSIMMLVIYLIFIAWWYLFEYRPLRIDVTKNKERLEKQNIEEHELYKENTKLKEEVSFSINKVDSYPESYSTDKIVSGIITLRFNLRNGNYNTQIYFIKAKYAIIFGETIDDKYDFVDRNSMTYKPEIQCGNFHPIEADLNLKKMAKWIDDPSNITTNWIFEGTFYFALMPKEEPNENSYSKTFRLPYKICEDERTRIIDYINQIKNLHQSQSQTSTE